MFRAFSRLLERMSTLLKMSGNNNHLSRVAKAFITHKYEVDFSLVGFIIDCDNHFQLNNL
ncbi:hypothetical protein BHE17_05305 [Planococcus maritimus]|nr:hypothetical protein AY633_08800 [Planococcus maritimus]OED31881.1 hypothetical protein BHE17_05305 [Planococcus maritimus]